MMAACPDCGAALRGQPAGDYEACPGCGTYVLQSSAGAEVENAAFFNTHFRDAGVASTDEYKRRIFQWAEARDRARQSLADQPFQLRPPDIPAMLRRPGQRVLEIGFGDGTLLAQLLQDGVDAWGEDLSQTAIKNFQRAHPTHADRVRDPGATPGAFDLIYGAALFEHVDDPGAFLRAAQMRLQAGGRLVLDQFPLTVSGPADLTPADDICFWKPCHRVLHSLAGLRRVTADAGFSVDALASVDSFNYRVLSLHRRAGYPVIETLRNSCRADPRLPGRWRYRWICWRAQRIRSRCQVASVILCATANLQPAGGLDV